MPVTAYIALGSNLGDRFGYVDQALQLLRATPGLRLAAMSPILEYDAVGGPPQGKYLNAVVAVETTVPVEALAARLKAIEQEMGRRPSGVQWAPRIIDLDLLLYGEMVLQTPALTVPHPRMHERRFVLEPLNQIAPHTRHPVLGKDACELLAALPG